MRNILAVAAAIVAAGLTSLPANAALVTETYSFSLGGFVDINGSPPLPSPLSNISGSFTVTFDPTLNYDNDTTDLVVHSLTGDGLPLTLDSQVGFTYDASGHHFWLGGVENDADLVLTGTNDFVLTYDLTNLADPQFVPCSTPGFLCGANTGNPAYDTSGFTTQGNNSLWFIAAADSTTSVPEPATWAMLLAGLLGMGAIMRAAHRRASKSA